MKAEAMCETTGQKIHISQAIARREQEHSNYTYYDQLTGYRVTPVNRKVTPHFRVLNAASGPETRIHEKAKQCIEKHKEIRLPDGRTLKFTRVEIEHRCDAGIIDVVGYEEDGTKWFIEIHVFHKVGQDKISKIQEMGVSAIEIVLTDLASESRFQAEDWDADTSAIFLKMVTKNAKRHWLYNFTTDGILQRYWSAQIQALKQAVGGFLMQIMIRTKEAIASLLRRPYQAKVNEESGQLELCFVEQKLRN